MNQPLIGDGAITNMLLITGRRAGARLRLEREEESAGRLRVLAGQRRRGARAPSRVNRGSKTALTSYESGGAFQYESATHQVRGLELGALEATCVELRREKLLGVSLLHILVRARVVNVEVGKWHSSVKNLKKWEVAAWR